MLVNIRYFVNIDADHNDGKCNFAQAEL